MAGPSLGTNLSGLEDWSTSFPFVNQFLMTRNWFTQTESEWDSGDHGLLDLDENGWVRAFTRDGSAAPFQNVSTIWQTNGEIWRPGVYVLDWVGEGEIGISGDATVLSEADGRVTFRLNGPGAVAFSLLSTDPAGTGDYLRDMRLYHSADADLIEAGEIFNPAFLHRIEDFRVLRFMDWAQTNNSIVDGIEDLRPFDAARQTGAGGASLAMMVELANQTRADAWFTIPHLADDAYITAFASYVRDNLDAGLVARFEFSNEVWNWGFDQADWAQASAVAAWGANVEGGWMQWYGLRAGAMATIVADVFGAETGTRALNVFSTQAGWHGLEYYALNAPEVVADGGIGARDAPFHIYAIAPYFGGSVGSLENVALVDRWIAMGAAGFTAALAYIRSGPAADSLAHIGSTIAYHAGIARSLGWTLEAYEGGQHVVDLQGLFGGAQDPAQTAFFIELVRRPEFQQLYLDYFQIWRDNGGGLMANFSDFGPPSQYGSWGIWDSVYSPDTPRSLAVQAFRDGVEAWWADGRPGTTFDNGLTLIDTTGRDTEGGSALADALFGLGGNDRAYGRGGDDLIHGGAGQDVLNGNRGHDRLLGGTGHDLLFGDSGLDSLIGGDGNDTLIGGSAGDTLTGGNGNDRLGGESGNDSLDGGAGADRILGGDGDDRLIGGPGNDTLIGGRGNDRMWGAAGADVFEFRPGDAGAVIADFLLAEDNLALDRRLADPGDTAAAIVADHARVTSGGVLFVFDNGVRILLEGLTTTAGLAGAVELF